VAYYHTLLIDGLIPWADFTFPANTILLALLCRCYGASRRIFSHFVVFERGLVIIITQRVSTGRLIFVRRHYHLLWRTRGERVKNEIRNPKH